MSHGGGRRGCAPQVFAIESTEWHSKSTGKRVTCYHDYDMFVLSLDIYCKVQRFHETSEIKIFTNIKSASSFIIKTDIIMLTIQTNV